MRKIPDLHFKVIPAEHVFCRAAHLVVFFRHDKDGRAFIDDNFIFYGENGTKTRAAAFAYGRNIVTRRTPRPLRNTYITAGNRARVRAAGLDPDYRG